MLTSRTGKEGYYPELEAFMLKRLAELDPVKHQLPLSAREQYDIKESVSKELNVFNMLTKGLDRDRERSRTAEPIKDGPKTFG